jgi:DNA-binding transcriptional ArsR family regulator
LQNISVTAQTPSPGSAIDQSAGEVQGIAPNGQVYVGQLIRRMHPNSLVMRFYLRGLGYSEPLPTHIVTEADAKIFARQQISAGLWTHLPLGDQKVFPSRTVIVNFGDLNRPWMQAYSSLSASGLHTALELPNNAQGGKTLGQAVLAEGVQRAWPMSGNLSPAFKTAYNKALADHFRDNLGPNLGKAFLTSLMMVGRRGVTPRPGASKLMRATTQRARLDAPQKAATHRPGSGPSPTMKTAATRSVAQLARLFTNKEAMHAYIASGAVTYAVQLFENWNHQQRGIDLFKLNASQQNELLWALGTAPLVGAAGEAVLAPILNAVQTAWLARRLLMNSRAVAAARLPELLRSLPAKARLEVLTLLGRLNDQSARSFFKALEAGVNAGNLSTKLRRIGIVLTAETIEHLGQHWLYLRGRKAVETELKTY